MKRLTHLLYCFILLFIFGCASDNVEDLRPERDPVDPNAAVIWDGPTVVFSKADDADHTLEANQDRITDNVWLTRDNDGGPIFNIQVESSNNNNGPTGTEWAIGTVDNLESLQFSPLRQALGGQRMSFQEIVGQDMVLYLVEDDVYLSIRFTAWSSGKGGGFAYERSSMP